MERRSLLRLVPGAAALARLEGRLEAAPGAGAVPPAADLGWWREARFGMFVHWGPVSLRGTEIGWSRGDKVPVEEYDALYRRFDPQAFDARAWARLAKDAGMRYLVLTTKHHDGFCLWPSRLTDYDIGATPFRRDVVGELSRACRDEGLVFCAYHSICDWRHPDYPLGSPGGKTRKPSPNMDRYVEYLKGQLAELLTTYGPLGILWFDGEWEEPWTEARGIDLYRYCRALQPSVIVNNRVAKGREDLAGTTREGAFAGDYDTPEQQVGRYQDARPWESCITICRQWAWKPDDELKPLAECVRTLASCAGGDGNLLLNVGPMPTGEIEPRQAARLRELGDWLKLNGESVYGTRGGPWKPAPWGVSTRRGDLAYLHVLEWPGESLEVPAIEPSVIGASVLGGGSAEVKATSTGLSIRVAAADRKPIDTVVRLRLDGPSATLAAR
jgi:alpha-L-fucosidase